MRTHLEFQSPAFDPAPGEDEETNPGIFGKRLAEYLADAFRQLGYGAPSITSEDHGWWVQLDNRDFPLALICASHDAPPNWLVCIEPSQPKLRKLFKSIDTTAVVETIAVHLETTLLASGKATDLRWWNDHDSGRH
ncbi:MAG: hypothetical protein ACOYO0_13570 [Sandarakinorhabdus sp.]